MQFRHVIFTLLAISLYAITFNAHAQTFVVTDFGLDAVFRVDPTTGDRIIISDSQTGSGPLISQPRPITIEADGQLLVGDQLLDAIFRVDPGTGNRTIVSDASTGTGTGFSLPHDIAVDGNGQIIVADFSLQALISVDPTTGDRTILSDSNTGSGVNFGSVRYLAIEADGNILVTDNGIDAILRVDPNTGNRTIVSDASNGTGFDHNGSIAFDFVWDIVIEANGDIIVTDNTFVSQNGVDWDGAVRRVDPVTGDRTVVSDFFNGSGPAFGTPISLAERIGWSDHRAASR